MIYRSREPRDRLTHQTFVASLTPPARALARMPEPFRYQATAGPEFHTSCQHLTSILRFVQRFLTSIQASLSTCRTVHLSSVPFLSRDRATSPSAW